MNLLIKKCKDVGVKMFMRILMTTTQTEKEKF